MGTPRLSIYLRGTSGSGDNGTGFAAGVVAGRHFHLGRVRLLFEADGAFGSLPTAARQLDPVGLDETAAAELHWVGS
ncbi:MAG: hypothetical protein F4123_07435, partial [Gemmatimonadetes bacterium]|nr:hypothetical protein [Gemmatimonadota bacterium]